jgi:hypothetical protein
MGKFKKIFSSSSWETSDFGGFSQVLWDLPEVSIPSGFNINFPENAEYLSYYSKNKLLGYFFLAVKKYKLTSALITESTQEQADDPSFSFLATEIVFDKKKVKEVLSTIIAKEVELKSLFINYSNLLSNSKIYYRSYIAPESLTDKYIVDKIQDVREKKRFAYQTNNYFPNASQTFDELKSNTQYKLAHVKSEPIIYTESEITRSEKLLNLLDISFEQDVTKINNLRTGKLDIPKIAEVMSGNHLIYFKKELHDRTKPFRVCILNDESGSMGEPRRYFYNDESYMWSRSEMQHYITKMMYRAFSQILPPDKISVYGHTGNYDPAIHIYQDNLNPNFEYSYDSQFNVEFYQNYDGPVVSRIYDTIRSYTSDAILFIVVSDGYPAGENYGSPKDIDDYKRIIEKCKRDNFVTCGIGLQHSGVKNLYNYNTVVNNLEKAPELVSALINNVVKSEFQ